MEQREKLPEQFRRDYEALQEKLRHYEFILDRTEHVLFDWDYVSDTVSVSETWQKMRGCPQTGSGIFRALEEGGLFHPEDVPLLLDRIGELKKGSDYEIAQVRILSARGNYQWHRIRAAAIRHPDGRLQKVLGIVLNIDAEKREEQLLQERAEQDPLTKLLNKTAARDRAEEYLSRFRGGAECALLIIDLDHFKQINDRFGHLYGDSVLARAAREISRLFRPQDIVARIGGDEFMVLMRGVSDRTLVEERCRRLLENIGSAFPGQKNVLSCSIGAALAPAHGRTYVELFQKADRALYCAKARGRNTGVIYSEEEVDTGRIHKTMVGGRIDSDEQPDLTVDHIFQYAFRQLYASRDVDASISRLLALIGSRINVSRVYVFENSEDNRSCSNTYEWCNTGIRPEIQNLQNVSYETQIPDYERNFDESGIFYCPDIRTLPRNLRDILEPQGIRSILHCAIREEGVFRGYIGFDDCLEYRMWTKGQIRLLKDFSGMLAVFLMQLRSQERSRRRMQELHAILDSRDAWIYILDPDTFQIRYCNEKVCRDTGAQPGMFCYRALMGREDRCPSCPAAGIRQKKNGSAVLKVPGFSAPLLADAGMIRWNAEEACLMTCRELPEQWKV